MTKLDKVKNSAYMVISDLSYCFEKHNNIRYIRVYNNKDLKQTTLFLVRPDGSCLMQGSNMSEANKYKCLALLERNKAELLRGYIAWESTQKSV